MTILWYLEYGFYHDLRIQNSTIAGVSTAIPKYREEEGDLLDTDNDTDD